MVVYINEGNKRLGIISLTNSKESNFKEVLGLNKKIPYKSKVYYIFADKLIQKEYEVWVKQ